MTDQQATKSQTAKGKPRCQGVIYENSKYACFHPVKQCPCAARKGSQVCGKHAAQEVVNG